MAFNGSGTFVRDNGTHTGSTVWAQDRDAGTKVTAANHDSHDQEIADGLTACICRNGESVITANLPMAGFRHTNVNAAAAVTEYARVKELREGYFQYLTPVAGTGDVITSSANPGLTAYVEGQHFRFIAANSNTGATTLDVNGVGAKAIQLNQAACIGGEIVSGDMIDIVYDGTQFQLMSQSGPAYLSITLTESMGATAAEVDMFHDDQYTGTLDYDSNVTARGIAFTSANGQFKVTNAGVYEATLNLVVAGNATNLIDILIQDGGVTFYDNSVVEIHDTNERCVTLTVIRKLAVNGYLNFLIDGGVNTSVRTGTTLSMKKIA